MNSDDITTAHARQIHDSLFKLTNYFARLVERMEKQHFPPDDPFYRKAKTAYDNVCSLYNEAHILSCKSGMGRPPRE